jgi:hypothetical protein
MTRGSRAGSRLLSLTLGSGLNGDGPVVVAVPAVRVMEVVVDEIVDVIAVRDLLVAAVRAVGVGAVVLAAGVIGCAGVRMLRVDLQDVLVDVVAVRVVEVAAVEVVDVVVMLDGLVAAAGPVLVGVAAVNGVL